MSRRIERLIAFSDMDETVLTAELDSIGEMD